MGRNRQNIVAPAVASLPDKTRSYNGVREERPMRDDVDLSGQPLTCWPELPGAPADVRRLVLDRADLQQVPMEVALLEGLEELHLDGTRLEMLPPAIADLACLRRLSLY